MRLALALLLLAAPLAAQEPVDTARATAELAISFDPGAIVVRGDTTFVFVSTTIESDSLASAVDRASLALQAAILRDGGQVQKSGPPGWFYGGVLLSAAGFVLAYAFKDETTTINVNQSQEQTTTVTTRRWPWCWPGFGKGKDRECEDE